MEGCQHPHDDPLVIRAVVANKTIHTVLIYNESSADIIFSSAFDKMGIGREARISQHPPTGILRERVLPVRSIQLVLTMGDPPCQATTTVKFLLVDAPLAYNMLLGRPSLNAIRAIPSAYHRVIKFPTANGVGMVRGDQHMTKECYSALMKQRPVDSIYVDELAMRDELSTRPMPSEELELIHLDDQPELLVYFGSRLPEDIRDHLIRFLRQNTGAFAWKQEDMGGIDPAVITHKLNVSPSFKPVKQKRRSFALEGQKAKKLKRARPLKKA